MSSMRFFVRSVAAKRSARRIGASSRPVSSLRRQTISCVMLLSNIRFLILSELAHRMARGWDTTDAVGAARRAVVRLVLAVGSLYTERSFSNCDMDYSFRQKLVKYYMVPWPGQTLNYVGEDKQVWVKARRFV